MKQKRLNVYAMRVDEDIPKIQKSFPAVLGICSGVAVLSREEELPDYVKEDRL